MIRGEVWDDIAITIGTNHKLKSTFKNTKVLIFSP